MTEEEIFAKEDDIIEFSGLKAFIDAPIRTYSSGMRARLGLALHVILNLIFFYLMKYFQLETYEFRKKSKQKILDMVEGDTTVVVVSHNIQTLERNM